MSPHIDLVGKTIGEWKILGVNHIDTHHNYVYDCLCLLCNTTIRSHTKQHIEKSQTYGCGCQKQIDLTNQKIGCWTVIKKIEDTSYLKNPRKTWLCQCICGKYGKVAETRLLNNKNPQMSCGCMNKKTNDIITHDLYAEIILSNVNQPCLIDIDDLDKIRTTYWDKTTDGYAIGSNGLYKNKRMHRVIMNVEQSNKPLIDHINHDRLDNRKNNLRIVSDQQNAFNQKLRINNTSGVTGVGWWKRDNNWSASIKYNYKHISLGYFDSFEDAVKARLEAEIKYFGAEYAPQRHLFEQYGVQI